MDRQSFFFLFHKRKKLEKKMESAPILEKKSMPAHVADLLDDDYKETQEKQKKQQKEEKENKEEKKEEKKQQEGKEEEEEASSLDEEEGKAIVVLISKDKQEFEIDKKSAFISELVRISLEQDPDSKQVVIPGVDARIMRYVVDYMKHHKGVEPPIVPKPLRSSEMKNVCSDPWDADFIDDVGKTMRTLYDVILASNYLNINSLLHLGCAKVASRIKGKPLEQVKNILADKDEKECKKQEKD